MSKPIKSFVYVLVALLVTASHSAVADADSWISHYYEQPSPERFVAEVRAMSRAGQLASPNTRALITVFLGRVMAANPNQVALWLGQLGDLKGDDRQVLLDAAKRSGTTAAQAFLARQPDADADADAVKQVDIRAVAVDSAPILDALWADFFATGDAAPVRRIVGGLVYGDSAGALERYARSDKTASDRDQAMRDAVFKAAMWSLESNARQHRRVGAILEQIYFSGDIKKQEQLWLSVILAKTMPDKYAFDRASSGQWTFTRKTAAQPSAGWRDGKGKAKVDTEATRSSDGFAGSLLATTDEDWAAKWNTPPEVAPNFTMAESVPYGKKIHILTFFANPRLDANGKAEVRCDFRIIAPGGKVTLDEKNANCFAGALQGDPNAMRLSAPVIAFAGDAGDPAGSWTIEVTLRDTVRNVALPLRTRFELKQP